MKNNFREKSHLKYKKLYLLSTERVKKRYSFSRIIGGVNPENETKKNTSLNRKYQL